MCANNLVILNSMLQSVFPLLVEMVDVKDTPAGIMVKNTTHYRQAEAQITPNRCYIVT